MKTYRIVAAICVVPVFFFLFDERAHSCCVHLARNGMSDLDGIIHTLLIQKATNLVLSFFYVHFATMRSSAAGLPAKESSRGVEAIFVQNSLKEL